MTFEHVSIIRKETSNESSPRNYKNSTEDILAEIHTSDNAKQRARAELRVLEQERSKLEKQRKAQLQEFETAKNESRRLLDVC